MLAATSCLTLFEVIEFMINMYNVVYYRTTAKKPKASSFQNRSG